MKKILKNFIKCFIIALILILLFISFLLLNWQNRYIYNHDRITIMGKEYFFESSLILHSEKEFRSVSVGITYEELVKKFGYENGQLNSNGLKNGIYYALAEDRFVVFGLVTSLYASENGEITRTLTVWRIALCDDKEELEILSEDRGIYEAAIPTWDLALVGDKDTTN